jgi:hypothetical protein
VPSVGSIPLPAAETVFRTLAAATGPDLKRLPDGETGIRKTSIRFLQQVLDRNGRSACALALRSSRPSPFNRHSPGSRQLRESRVVLLTGLGNANRPPRKAILFLPELEVRIQFPPAESQQTFGSARDFWAAQCTQEEKARSLARDTTDLNPTFK